MTTVHDTQRNSLRIDRGVICTHKKQSNKKHFVFSTLNKRQLEKTGRLPFF